MAELNVDTRLLKILDLDLKIKTNIFKKVIFQDENLEKLYQKTQTKKNEIFLQGDKVIFIGWLCIFVYVYFGYFRKEVFSLFLIMYLLSMLLIVVNNLISPASKIFINYIQVSLITIYLNAKVIYLNYLTYYYDQNTQGEILRTLIYDFVSNNLLSLLILEENILAKIIFISINVFSIFISKYVSKIDDFYELDAITSICYSLIFHMLKKVLEFNLRSVFSERYCLEKLHYYSNDFILELNGLHFNRNINESMVSGNNIHEIFSDLIKNNCETEINKEEKMDLMYLPNSNNESDLYLKSLKKYERESNYNEMENPSLYEELEKVKKVIEANKKFTNIGIFYNPQSKNIKYYEVYHRKFCLTEYRIIDDIFFYDVTNYITAQKKIDEENVIKQKIFAKISHEFKTPINSIIGLIENIKDSIMNEDKASVMKYLDSVKNLSKYIIYLTNDIIQFSSIKSCKAINIYYGKVNMKEVCEFGYEILVCLLRCNSFKSGAILPVLKFDDKIGNVVVYSDEVRLKQILLNFISNAVKFTKSGTISIIAELDQLSKNIILSVSDSGVGINEDDKKKLFEEFSIIKNSQINNSFGSGLGLSVCKNLSSSLNLSILSTSIYGEGSRFSIKIPYQERNLMFLTENKFINSNEISTNLQSESLNGMRYNENSNINIKTEFKISEEFLTNSSGDDSLNDTVILDNHPQRFYSVDDEFKNDQKILIVDDNIFISQSVTNILEQVLKDNNKNYELIRASDGIDILQKIREDQSQGNLIKCIITDENMEYLNGSDAIKILREFEKQGKIKNVKIITSTCHEDDTILKLIYESGSDAIIPKPLNRTALTKVLRELNIIH